MSRRQLYPIVVRLLAWAIVTVVGHRMASVTRAQMGVQLPPGYGNAAGGYGSPYGTSPGGSSVSLGPGIQPYDPYAAPQQGWPAPGLAPAPGMGGSPYAAPSPSPFAAPPPGMPASGGTVGSMLASRRLFQDTGVRYTLLTGGDEGDTLQMHDVELSTTAFFPRFLFAPGPVRITPGFVFHFLDGPSGPLEADLPGQLYSAYVDGGWAPELSPTLGAEVNFRAGVYTDFDTVTMDSLRFMGTGLGVFRMSQNLWVKLGAAYIDRNRIKVLPAGGLLWQPNPRTRWDLFFPSPKLSTFWTTFGNSHFWWYLGGEYGGGAWTFSRLDAPDAGASERFDYNDIRVMLGLEWTNLSRAYGFVEAGYVFARELVFVVVPSESADLANTFMIRGGIAF